MNESKKKGMVVWLTAISGAQAKETLGKLNRHLENKKETMKVYHVGKMIFEEARLNSIHMTKEKCLFTPRGTINALRAAVFWKILASLQNDLVKYDAVVINLHTYFFWQDSWVPAYNIHYMKIFNPDIFITFRDKEENILKRLNERGQWKNQHLTKTIIRLWQQNEINNSREYHINFPDQKPHYTFDVNDKIAKLYKLLFKQKFVHRNRYTPIEPNDYSKVKNRGQIICCTAIPGCGEKEYLDKIVKYCEQQDKKAKVWNLGDIIKEVAEFNGDHFSHEDMLNNYMETRYMRAAAFERILNNIYRDLDEYDMIVVNIHTNFLWRSKDAAAKWKRDWITAFNMHYLKRLNPDMFVCFVDSALKIIDELNRRPMWQAQEYTEQEIWLWQENEVNKTEEYRFLFEGNPKPFYTIPIGQKVQTLHHLVFEPWRTRVYAQMPISHIKDESELDKVRGFMDWLWKYFVVFDPLTIDIVDSTKDGEKLFEYEPTDNDKRTRLNQTVIRDRYWHIGQSETCIAYFPELHFTAGVVDETREAQDTNKGVMWGNFQKQPGPFEDYLVQPDLIFPKLSDMKKYIAEVMAPTMEERKRVYLESLEEEAEDE